MLLRKIRQCVIKLQNLVAGYTIEISAEKHISKSHIEMEMHIRTLTYLSHKSICLINTIIKKSQQIEH